MGAKCKLLFFFMTSILVQAQEVGVVKGRIIDAQTRALLPYVNVVVQGAEKGAVTDEKGEFEINDVALGYIKVVGSFVGYIEVVSADYLVTKEKSPFIKLEMIENSAALDEVEVKANLFKRSAESPVSLQNLGIAEIEKNSIYFCDYGGGSDVLKEIIFRIGLCYGKLEVKDHNE